ncbi:MAG TPA: hypothetical protein VJ043_00225, partial [Candidatus Paceibacterota bacterium]|nr:hypothetical protein [Candidatus Paceibacterota bacterium]
MKQFVLLVFLLQTISPTLAYALECNKDRITVVYVNGILTNKRDAQDDTDLLRIKYEQITHHTDVDFLTGYNQ